jgi:hypothetical protein
MLNRLLTPNPFRQHPDWNRGGEAMKKLGRCIYRESLLFGTPLHCVISINYLRSIV